MKTIYCVVESPVSSVTGTLSLLTRECGNSWWQVEQDTEESTVYSVQWTVDSVQCIVYTVYCTVYIGMVCCIHLCILMCSVHTCVQ